MSVKCVVCNEDLDGLWCTTNVCEGCCKAGKCSLVAFCKAAKEGSVKIVMEAED